MVYWIMGVYRVSYQACQAGEQVGKVKSKKLKVEVINEPKYTSPDQPFYFIGFAFIIAGCRGIKKAFSLLKKPK